jgi:hypothetical protein
MNTRTFPRTTAEAFKGVDYACALERPDNRSERTIVIAAVWLCVAACVAAVFL